MVAHYYRSTQAFNETTAAEATASYIRRLEEEALAEKRPKSATSGWIDVTVKPPRQGSYVIILTEGGLIHKAKATKKWLGGFCIGDGKSGTIPSSPVTHYIPFKEPTKCKS
jgi:hypothetical protein